MIKHHSPLPLSSNISLLQLSSPTSSIDYTQYTSTERCSVSKVPTMSPRPLGEQGLEDLNILRKPDGHRLWRSARTETFA